MPKSRIPPASSADTPEDRLQRAKLRTAEAMPETDIGEEKGAKRGGRRSGRTRAPRVVRRQRVETQRVRDLARLTEEENLLLRAILTSDSLDPTPAELSALTGLTEPAIRAIKASAAFQGALTQAMIASLGEGAPGVVRAWIKSAMILGKNGHSDRRMYLEAIGLVQSKSATSTINVLQMGDKAGQKLADRLARAINDTGRAMQIAQLAADDPLDVVVEGEAEAA